MNAKQLIDIARRINKVNGNVRSVAQMARDAPHMQSIILKVPNYGVIPMEVENIIRDEGLITGYICIVDNYIHIRLI